MGNSNHRFLQFCFTFFNFRFRPNLDEKKALNHRTSIGQGKSN